MSTYDERHNDAVDELIELQREVTIALSSLNTAQITAGDFVESIEATGVLEGGALGKAGEVKALTISAYNMLVEAAERLREISKAN